MRQGDTGIALIAVNMYIPAESTMRPLVIIPSGESLLTGDFPADRQVRTLRSTGTNDWQLLYTVAGAARFGWPGGEYIVGPGEAVLLRPGTPHDYGNHPTGGRWENLWAHFHPGDNWLDLLEWPEVAPGIMHLRFTDAVLRRQIRAGLAEMHQLATGSSARRERLALHALEGVLLQCAEVATSGTESIDGRVRVAMERLCRQLDQALSIAAVAKAVGLSPSRFAHLFRAQTGATPARYREQQRLRRACQLLLATDHTIADIAATVGFPDPLHFSVRFKRFAGASPRQWRDRRRRHRL